MLIYILIPVLFVVFFIFFSRIILTLLFYPETPKTIAGIKIQGILSAKIPVFITQAKALAVNAIPAFDEIENKLTGEGNTEKIMHLADGHIDNFLRNKLKEKIPVVSIFIGDKTINQLKNIFMDELRELFPSAIKAYMESVKKDFNLSEIIDKAMGADTESKIIQILKNEIKKSISSFVIFASAFGLVSGLITDTILYFAQ